MKKEDWEFSPGYFCRLAHMLVIFKHLLCVLGNLLWCFCRFNKYILVYKVVCKSHVQKNDNCSHCMCVLLQLIERHLLLMACELIVFILLLMYTSSRQHATLLSNQSPASIMPSNHSSSHPFANAHKQSTQSESTKMHRSTRDTIDMDVSSSPRRRRSVDQPSRSPWTDAQQQTVKSGWHACSFLSTINKHGKIKHNKTEITMLFPCHKFSEVCGIC